MKFAYYIFFAILNLIGTVIWGYFYMSDAAPIYIALPLAILASIACLVYLHKAYNTIYND